MERCYFLPDDFTELLRRIAELRARMREIGADMGAACNEGAETFHDNFAFEDGGRRQFMWGEELRRLTHIRDAAHLVQSPPTLDRVSLGRTVQLRDSRTGEERRIRIGSYISFSDDPSVVSYRAPIAAVIMGAEPGDVCEGQVHGREVEIEILSVA